MQCPNGHEVSPDASFCPTCGASLAVPAATVPHDEADNARSDAIPSDSPRHRLWWILAGLLLVGGIGVAGGALYLTNRGPSAEEKAATRKADCEALIGDFVRSLEDLNGRLAVGVVYADYQTKVGDIASAHGRLNTGELDDRDCLAAAAEGEKALQSYDKAGDFWSRCVSNFNAPNCRTSAARSAKLQPYWSDASDAIAEMNDMIEALGSPD